MADRSLDDVLRDLQRARAAFESATGAQRAELSGELDRLRAEARESAGDPLTQLTDRILDQRIRRATEQLRDIESRRFSPASIGGMGPQTGGIDPALYVKHNETVDRNYFRAEIETELRALSAERQRRDGKG